MAEYNVNEVAQQLMLDVADLQEIYEVFFDDAQLLLTKCQQFANEQNNVALKKELQNLKGVANNLRMQEIGQLVAGFEGLVMADKEIHNELYLLELHNKIQTMKEYINHFYTR